jgi:cytochrome P450
MKPPPRVSRLDIGGELRRDYLGVLSSMAAEYGPVVSYVADRREFVLLTDPTLVHVVLTAPPSQISIGPGTEIESTWLGQGLFTNWTPGWRQKRATIQRSLGHSQVRRFVDLIVSRAHSRFGQLGDTVELVAEMRELALEVVTAALFSDDIATALPAVRQLTVTVTNYWAAAFFDPTTADPAPVHAARKALDAFVYDAIDRRRTALGQRRQPDLFAALLAATDADGNRLTDTEVRDEVASIILAGHGTTASALAFAFSLLGRHPQVYRRLQAEMDQRLAGRPATDADLSEMAYPRQIIEETLRLYPALYTMDRTAVKGIDLDGVFVEPGTVIVIGTWMVHHDPRWFPNPSDFDPERFADSKRQEIPQYAYLPFGDGPRICVGKHFALLQATLVLATFAQMFAFDLLAPDPPPLLLSAGLAPRDPIPARISRRGGHLSVHDALGRYDRPAPTGRH